MKNFKKFVALFFSFIFIFNMAFVELSNAEDSDKDTIIKALGDDYKTMDKMIEGASSEDYGAEFFYSGDRNIKYILYRIFGAPYIYDVTEYTKSRDKNYDEKEIRKVGDKSTVCTSSRDGGLLYHNCDLPTLLTGLVQNNIMYEQGVIGAGKTTAYNGEVGFGTPKSITDGSIPLNLKNAKKEYTALERFGYDLRVTSYRGEWDHVIVNNSARLLSNFGLIDKLVLGGKSLMSGITGFFEGVINGFSWNPLKWLSNAVSNAVGNSVGVIMDTSDANIAATRAWGRPGFASTVYGAHYLSSKQVVEKADAKLQEYILKNFEKIAKKNPVLKPWLNIQHPIKLDDHRHKYPEFSNQKEHEKSIADRKQWAKDKQAREASIRIYENCTSSVIGDTGMTPDDPNIVQVCGIKPQPFTKPQPPYVKGIPLTPEEEFDYFRKDPDVQKWATTGDVGTKGMGAALDDASVKNYQDFKIAYDRDFKSKLSADTNDTLPHMEKIYNELSSMFAEENPYLNTEQEISHWVCLSKENPTTEDIIKAPHLFKATSDGFKNSEINTKECGTIQVRPSIKGGLKGTGDGKSTDTRRTEFDKNSSANPTGKATGQLSQFFIKTTNELIDLTFGDVLQQLGLTDLAVKIIESFRDGVFFPLSVLAIAISGLFIMFKTLSRGTNSYQILKMLAGLVFLFMFSVMILYKPKDTLKAIDLLPRTIESELLEAIYNKSSVDDKLCSATGSSKATRTLQCDIWKVGIFNPWVTQQFGTNNWTNLDTDKMTNTNGDLVGKATTYLGGDKIINNWALYQLSVTKSGNISAKDPNTNEGNVDKNIYRLVDLQFGPNKGEASDDTYASVWSGRDRKSSSGILSVIFSVLMLMVFGRMAIYKTEITLIVIVNFMLFPFMAILGLLPGGAEKFKNYLANLLSLLAKRVMTVLLFIVFLKILMGAGGASIPVKSYLLVCIILLLAFKQLWKQYLSMLDTSFGAGSDIMSGRPTQLRQNLRQAYNSVTPKFIKEKANIKKYEMTEMAGGAVAGGVLAIQNALAKDKIYIEDDSKNSKTGYKQATSWDIIRNSMAAGKKVGGGRAFNKNRREGFSVLTSLKMPLNAMNKELANEITHGGRTADSNATALAFKKINAMFDLGITEKQLQENPSLQRLIREYANLNEEFLLKSQIEHKRTPDGQFVNPEDVVSSNEDLESTVREMAEYEAAIVTKVNKIKAKEEKDRLKNKNKNKADKDKDGYTKEKKYGFFVDERYEKELAIKESIAETQSMIQTLKEKEREANEAMRQLVEDNMYVKIEDEEKLQNMTISEKAKKLGIDTSKATQEDIEEIISSEINRVHNQSYANNKIIQEKEIEELDIDEENMTKAYKDKLIQKQRNKIVAGPDGELYMKVDFDDLFDRSLHNPDRVLFAREVPVGTVLNEQENRIIYSTNLNMTGQDLLNEYQQSGEESWNAFVQKKYEEQERTLHNKTVFDERTGEFVGAVRGGVYKKLDDGEIFQILGNAKELKQTTMSQQLENLYNLQKKYGEQNMNMFKITGRASEEKRGD